MKGNLYLYLYNYVNVVSLSYHLFSSSLFYLWEGIHNRARYIRIDTLQYTGMCMFVYICMCVCVCICVCLCACCVHVCVNVRATYSRCIVCLMHDSSDVMLSTIHYVVVCDVLPFHILHTYRASLSCTVQC